MDAVLSPRIAKLLKYSLLFSTYTLLGSVVFMSLEKNGGNTEEIQRKRSLQQSLKAKMKLAYNISGVEFDALARDFVDAYSVLKDTTWDFNKGFVFVVQLVTTIGYGNIAPVTQGGRLFCIIYAFFGIVITVLTLQVHGENMFALEKKLITKLENVCLKKVSVPQQLAEKCLIFNAVLAIIFIVVGAIVEILTTSGSKEPWNFVDGIYVWFITFTTIGFGDLIPGNQLPQWFACLYTFIGLCIMSSLLNALTACPYLSPKSIAKTCVSCCIRQNVGTVPAADTFQIPSGTPGADESKNETDVALEGASPEKPKKYTQTEM